MTKTSYKLIGKSTGSGYPDLVQAPSLPGEEHSSSLPRNTALTERLHEFMVKSGKREVIVV